MRLFTHRKVGALTGKIFEHFQCERLGPYLMFGDSIPRSVVRVCDPSSDFDGREVVVEDSNLDRIGSEVAR